MARVNDYLDQGISDASDAENGYDSEAAEISKTKTKTERRGTKRRKLSHSSRSSDNEDDEESQGEEEFSSAKEQMSPVKKGFTKTQTLSDEVLDAHDQEIDYKIKSASSALPKDPKSKKHKKEKTPGVIYLSSLPPYLKPSALKNILAQRGFEPITRLFLTPASKHKHGSKKSSRQLYTEGWIEFANKKTAKRCAEALNAQLVGGKKGGFYYDDLWNMRYLKGMAWDELMAGIREERREEEGRRDEERRRVERETKMFVEGVEQGKKLEGMKRKRQKKENNVGKEEDVQRTWRQHEVAKDSGSKKTKEKKVDPQVQQVLSKIF